MRPESPPRSQKGSPRYHKLDLEIEAPFGGGKIGPWEVVKATDLPDAAILATSGALDSTTRLEA